VHDYNGGVHSNGLFWTVQLPGSAVSMDDGVVRLRARRVPIIDSFQFAGGNSTPATVDVDVTWRKTGPFELLGDGGSVPATDPAAFSGRFAPARANGRFSGIELGFRFTGSGTSESGYAEFGTERNGSFL
jgi:hypothetical protein